MNLLPLMPYIDWFSNLSNKVLKLENWEKTKLILLGKTNDSVLCVKSN